MQIQVPNAPDLLNEANGPVPKGVGPTPLNDTESMLVAALSRHAGWNIIVRMMETRIEEARRALFRVAPDASNRLQVLDGLQHEAHAYNQFASVLLMDVKYHSEKVVAGIEEKKQDVEATLAQQI